MTGPSQLNNIIRFPGRPGKKAEMPDVIPGRFESFPGRRAGLTPRQKYGFDVMDDLTFLSYFHEHMRDCPPELDALGKARWIGWAILECAGRSQQICTRIMSGVSRQDIIQRIEPIILGNDFEVKTLASEGASWSSRWHLRMSKTLRLGRARERILAWTDDELLLSLTSLCRMQPGVIIDLYSRLPSV